VTALHYYGALFAHVGVIFQNPPMEKIGMANELRLGNLGARRDWGFSKGYVRAMWLMLQQSRADDYVVATGETHSVRQLCEYTFTHVDLDYRDYVRVDSASCRPEETVQLVGDASRARHELGWQPQLKFRELIHMMVDADLKVLGGNNVLINRE